VWETWVWHVSGGVFSLVAIGLLKFRTEVTWIYLGSRRGDQICHRLDGAAAREHVSRKRALVRA
jgi:hypothetical protein